MVRVRYSAEREKRPFGECLVFTGPIALYTFLGGNYFARESDPTAKRQ